ncbi:uncharacterized protein LOC135679029 isoform X2 [Musa acuminata AAA Group]|uniref:uncharacterized protein LOC103992074 isoform X2 n=1 Tax=Musa acuminata AAA Group TaxID=214697 RepID=UPI0031DD051D
MDLYEQWKGILRIQKFRRMVSYAGFYCFVTLVSYAYTSNTKRAGFSNADQYYAAYPASIELLTDTAKLYKVALGNCFEEEEWGPIEFSIMAKHFERQGKPPYAYHALSYMVIPKNAEFMHLQEVCWCENKHAAAIHGAPSLTRTT